MCKTRQDKTPVACRRLQQHLPHQLEFFLMMLCYPWANWFMIREEGNHGCVSSLLFSCLLLSSLHFSSLLFSFVLSCLVLSLFFSCLLLSCLVLVSCLVLYTSARQEDKKTRYDFTTQDKTKLYHKRTTTSRRQDTNKRQHKTR